jgi:glycosidase
MTVPDWIQDAVFYQIFPDRFANGDEQNDPEGVLPWNSLPTTWGFHGGDFRGIIQKFGYLLDLGINAVYLNPIFLSNSNHRYHTVDYFAIDPRLGTLQDFNELIKVAHEHGVRIILDGVFNHCGRGFFPFVDLLENQENSSYRHWFHVRRFPVDAYSPGKAETYLAWWGMKGLPKLNTDHPPVRKYLLKVARYWIEQGIDGWRLDVPNEIDDDAFWAEFREQVKSANPEAYLLGEIWMADRRWVGDHHFDGLMNYPLREALLDLLNGSQQKVSGFVARVESIIQTYPWENACAMYGLLGSHDTERIYSKLDRNLNKVKMAFAFLFAFPGAPAVYYGDEIGFEGGKDPECRAPMIWDPYDWNYELLGWVKQLVRTRKQELSLRRGGYHRLLVDDQHGLYAFARVLGEQAIMVVMNASPVSRSYRINVAGLGWQEGRLAKNLLGIEEFLVLPDQHLLLNLPAWSTIWIK